MRDFIEKAQPIIFVSIWFSSSLPNPTCYSWYGRSYTNQYEQKTLFMWRFYWLKKAFDTVNHTILLDKLNYYGFRGIFNQWVSSYLSNRTQTAEIGSNISSKLNISGGVPQGSVLGLFLFLLFINDTQYCSSKLQFFLFADDTNVLYAHKDLKTLELTVNAELHNLYNWLTSNKLALNIKKSNYVIFPPYQNNSSMITRLMFLTMKAVKRLPLSAKLY